MLSTEHQSAPMSKITTYSRTHMATVGVKGLNISCLVCR